MTDLDRFAASTPARNLLGFDTSTAAVTACVLRADGESFEILPGADALAAPPGHARDLLPALASVIADAGLDWPEIDALAVGVGPGPFTGLRIGIATARALAQARAIALHPVSSLAALAAGVDAPTRLALIDAKRGELFAALYADSEELWPPYVASPELISDRLRARAETGKGRGEGILAAGDGALAARALIEEAGVRVAPPGSPAHLVRALNVCRLAATVPAIPPELVLPVYLRAPNVNAPARPNRSP